MHNIRKKALGVLACGASALLLGGCVNDDYAVPEATGLSTVSHVTLSFAVPKADPSTRSFIYDPDGYEEGLWNENYVDTESEDYRIYFFTNDKDDGNAMDANGKNTLIATFEPDEISVVDGTNYMHYTVTGHTPSELLAYTDFKVVMLANWGAAYPDVFPGETTIDALCEAETGTYGAFIDNAHDVPTAAMPDGRGTLIPFYGVREYKGISFTGGKGTTLAGDLTLLRAVAKVEIIFVGDGPEGDDTAFKDVTVHRYNSRGYCAPHGVYTVADYSGDYSAKPGKDGWPDAFVTGLHLVSTDASGNEINDPANTTFPDARTIAFKNVQRRETTTDGTTGVTTVTRYETWRAYLPEYWNMGDDYSYMTLARTVPVGSGTGDDAPARDYSIYFAEYTGGLTDAYGDTEAEDKPNRMNVKRNNLYRYYVTFDNLSVTVTLEVFPWVERLDNVGF